MRKRIAMAAGAAAAAALTLTACYPTYGGKTEKYDIGCAMRLGTTTYVGQGADGWQYFTCSGATAGVDTCYWQLQQDPRFSIDDRYAVCQVGMNWAYGSRGYIA